MDRVIKKKVLDWMDEKISHGKTYFDISSCIQDLGLDPFDRNDYSTVEEIFEWHQSLINHIYDVCMDKNT